MQVCATPTTADPGRVIRACRAHRGGAAHRRMRWRSRRRRRPVVPSLRRWLGVHAVGLPAGADAALEDPLFIPAVHSPALHRARRRGCCTTTGGYVAMIRPRFTHDSTVFDYHAPATKYWCTASTSAGSPARRTPTSSTGRSPTSAITHHVRWRVRSTTPTRAASGRWCLRHSTAVNIGVYEPRPPPCTCPRCASRSTQW